MHLRSLKKTRKDVSLHDPIGSDKEGNEITLIDNLGTGKTLIFDYVEREYKYNFFVDPIIKLNSPEQGFFYPSVTDNYSNMNRILYCTEKANEPNLHFIEQVLNAEKTVTAQEESAIFEDIVKEVAGEQLDAVTIAHVYEEIHRVIESNEEEESPKLDYKDVERMLTVSGVEDVTLKRWNECSKRS